MNTPNMKALFTLNADGKPEVIELDGRKHYRISLQVDAAPSDAYAVTYLLDKSFYQPVREARDPSGSFAEELTSYGDFVVQAKIRASSGITTVATPLSVALSLGHADDMTPDLQAAITDLANA